MSSLSSPRRSALYRRTLLSATLTPLLFTTGLLGMMGGYLFWSFLPMIGAAILSVRIPYMPAVTPAAQPLSDEVLRLNSRIRSFFTFVLFFGFFQLAEGKALLERLTNGSLWRWEILTVAAALTLMEIYRNHRVLRELSDEQVAAYHRGDGPIRFEGQLFRKIPALPKLPRDPLPPRPDPY